MTDLLPPGSNALVVALPGVLFGLIPEVLHGLSFNCSNWSFVFSFDPWKFFVGSWKFLIFVPNSNLTRLESFPFAFVSLLSNLTISWDSFSRVTSICGAFINNDDLRRSILLLQFINSGFVVETKLVFVIRSFSLEGILSLIIDTSAVSREWSRRRVKNTMNLSKNFVELSRRRSGEPNDDEGLRFVLKQLRLDTYVEIASFFEWQFGLFFTLQTPRDINAIVGTIPQNIMFRAVIKSFLAVSKTKVNVSDTVKRQLWQISGVTSKYHSEKMTFKPFTVNYTWVKKSRATLASWHTCGHPKRKLFNSLRFNCAQVY